MTISKNDLGLILSEAYVETLHMETLEQTKPLTFNDVENIIEFIFYNYFDIEVK